MPIIRINAKLFYYIVGPDAVSFLQNPTTMKSPLHTLESVESGWLLHENDVYIKFADIVKLLRDKRNDADVTIRGDNIFKQFRNQGGAKLINDQKYIRFSSLLRFIFIHFDDFEICRTVSNEIESKLLQTANNDKNHMTEKNLYEQIAKSESHSSIVRENVCQNNKYKFSTLTISSLNSDYVRDFTPDEWKKICVFE